MRADRTFRSFLFYFFISLTLLLLSSRGLIGPLYSLAQTVTVPVKTSLTNFKDTLVLPFRLILTTDSGKKVVELRGEVASLSSQLAAVESLREENIQLRRLLGAPLPASWKFTPARVVGRFQDKLLVVGEVSEGVPVIIPTGNPGFPAGILVGKTGQTYGRETEVFLPTHPESKIPAKTQDSSGLVLGRGGIAELDQVLTGESLEEGDLVLTSGGSGIPADLLIGEVLEVTSAGKTWKSARLNSPYEPADYVFLITDY